MIGCDSDNGGGRITPSTSLVAKRRVDLGLLVGVFGLAGFDDEVARLRCARACKRADQELAEIGGARIGVEQADMRRLARGEAARRGVRRVIELLDRLEHGGAGRFRGRSCPG